MRKQRKGKEKKKRQFCLICLAGEKTKENKREKPQYLVIALENPSTTREVRALAPEKERAIFFFQKKFEKSKYSIQRDRINLKRCCRKLSSFPKEENDFLAIHSS